METLYQDRHIRFDPLLTRWAWDVEAIRSCNFTDNVVEFMSNEFKRLPVATQQSLTLGSFLGNRFEVPLLARVSERSVAVLNDFLRPAIAVGLIARHNSDCRFLHDRVQEAAYLLTPAAERAATHARIGRRLRRQVRESEIEKWLFDIVFHLNAGAEVILDPGERLRCGGTESTRGVASARAAGVYVAAAVYFAAGITMLPADMWERHYDLALALHLGAAECEYLKGRLVHAERLLDIIVGRVTNALDRAKSYVIRVRVLMTRGDHAKARSVALHSMSELGTDLPEAPSSSDVERAYAEIDEWMRGRDIGALVDLPLVTDPAVAATIDLMMITSTASYFVSPVVWAFHTPALVALILRHGNVAAARDGVHLLWIRSGGRPRTVP